MNDLSFIDELTARLDEAADTADVALPTDLDLARLVGQPSTNTAPVRRLGAPMAPDDRQPDPRRWASIAAAALVVVGGGVAVLLTRPESGPSSTSTVVTTMPTSTIMSSTVPSSSVVDSTIAVAPVSTAPTVETVTATSEGVTGEVPTGPADTPALSRSIVPGDQGDDVLALQRRLSDLGFNVGSVDGVYGPQTVSAVWAFKTLVAGQALDQVTDDLTPELMAMMNGDVSVQPRRPGSGTHIEIYLPQQAMVVFQDDVPSLIAHISSGELDANGQPVEFCEHIGKSVGDDGKPLATVVTGEACGVSKTPGGVFEVGVELKGIWVGGTGVMMNPTYFNYMLAIHGAPEVPLHPASHGGVRVEPHIGQVVQTLVARGDKVFVWNGVQEPEDVSQQDALPAFDTFTPDEG